MTRIHVVRDTATEGADYFMWGVDDEAKALVTLAQARQWGEVEHVVIDIPTASPAILNDWYERAVGYRPQGDDPGMNDSQLRDLVASYAREAP